MRIDEQADEDRGYGEEGRTPEEQDRAAEGGGTDRPYLDELKVPPSTQAQDELVDRASEDSFPASDSPAYWQRAAASRKEADEQGDSANGGEAEKGDRNHDASPQ